MDRKRGGTVFLVCSVVFACVCMGIVDAVIRPGYVPKSAVKLLLFLGLPGLYAAVSRDGSLKRVLRPDRKGLLLAAAAGLAVYAVILSAFFLLRNVFDFSALTANLTAETGVNRQNFLWVALYISFVNSLLEEFFFRGYAFLTLKKQAGRRTAYCFSAAAFALYHAAMMFGWFDASVLALALAGLFAGGLIFNRFDERSGSIYLSWLVHMFANFATNTVGFLLFQS